MIVAGIFLLLLGTRIGQSSAIQSDVKYEPSRIAIREQIDQGPVLVPELGPPPYIPNFIHQGSNYFFGMPFPMAPALPPPVPPVETIVTEVRAEKDCNDLAIVTKPDVTEIVVERENIFRNPLLEVNEMISRSKFALPIPDLSLNLKPIPHLPSLPIVSTQQLVSQLPVPLPSLNIPGLPFLKTSMPPKVPMFIEGPSQSSGDFVITEVDVPMRKIPAPPELPPLILEKVIKPIIVEDKQVILVPSPPEIEAILPPSVFVSDSPCPPTLCAQNIVFERVLPNIICEKFKTVELISLPAARRVPVVTKPLLPFIKK